MYRLKPWFLRRLRRAEDAAVAHGISPDALTAAAAVVSIAAGAAIAAGGALQMPMLWLAVPPLVLARLALNALDGSVARRTHTARPFGVALNEAGDRIADAATIGSAAMLVSPALAASAVAGSFAASITGVTALAVHGTRDSGGPMGKADRAAVISAAALIGAATGSVFAFVVALWVILVGSLATVVLRLMRLRRALEAQVELLEPPVPSLIDVPAESDVEEGMLCALGR